MRRARSVIWRFGALVFLFQLLGAGLVLATVHQITGRALEANSRTLTQELRGELAASYRTGGASAARALIAARLADDGDAQSVMLLADASGRPLAGNLGAWPPTVVPGDPWRVVNLYRMESAAPERMGLLATRLPDGSRLLTGHVVESDLRFGGMMEQAMLSALLLALPLAVVAAWLSARLIQSRVRSIVTTAAAIETGEMDRRIPADGSGDAFEDLGRSINAMLDRIMALVGEMRLVTDGLAHDLRSPLTRLKAVLDRSLSDVRDADARTALGRALEEVDILLSMLTTALLISRTEAGIGREGFVAVDIAAMLRDLQEMYGALADERDVEIIVDAPATLPAHAHRELIVQALANLIDNALKYGGGHITLSARAQEDGSVMLGVADNGPGIPVEQREEALRRFGRLDAARHMSGAGLGLSLVAAVARLHGGTLRLGDNAPGLVASLTIAGPDEG
ncbi:HAMP domain-containing sensor histidine kinase [Sphingobium aquiterrae]|uniref:sensor histidine kinase n=1 Tax=Sphingobium aquiterrae TaxID=2038656 RepID=UPI00301B4AC0